MASSPLGRGFFWTLSWLEARDKKVIKTHPALEGFLACLGKRAPHQRIIKLRYLEEGARTNRQDGVPSGKASWRRKPLN